jgi:23S rRNA (cytidine1920-2'-O)/16S rRNA (cytidine1409-2'-O)-methyltransferase
VRNSAHRERLDKLVVDRGLAASRERAKALIMAGSILVDGVRISKPGTLVDGDADVVGSEKDLPFVSRGGMKLDAALDFFHIDPQGLVVMDIGCSTGGFTDCVLKRNARTVYAIDVGYGQFAWTLRQDPRVVLLERTNIRHLQKTAVPDMVDLVVIDVSFISLMLVLPRAVDFLGERGEVLALVKPQFEVGKGLVGKGGIVRDVSLRLSAVENITQAARGFGLEALGSFESPVRGQKGNIEYFIHMRRR